MPVTSFANIFSHSVVCLLFVYGFLCCAIAFELNQVSFMFVFISIYCGRWIKKDIAAIYVRDCVLPVFPYKSFIVSGLTFRSLIHFEFIFVYDVKECSNFIFHM